MKVNLFLNIGYLKRKKKTSYSLDSEKGNAAKPKSRFGSNGTRRGRPAIQKQLGKKMKCHLVSLRSEDANSADEDIVSPLSCPIHYARLQNMKCRRVILAI